MGNLGQGGKIQKKYQMLRMLNSLEKVGNRGLFLVLRGSPTTVKRTYSKSWEWDGEGKVLSEERIMK